MAHRPFALALVAALVLSGGPSLAQPVDATAKRAVDWLKKAAANFTIVMLRSVADVTFNEVQVSRETGGVVVTGLTLNTPDLDGHARGCSVRIARAEIAFDPLSLTGLGETVLRADLVTASPSCLPAQGRFLAYAASGSVLRLERLTLRTNYDLPSGRLDYELRADASGIAEVAAEGRLDYFSFRAGVLDAAGITGSGDPVPSILFGDARLSVVDKGAIGSLAFLFGSPDRAADQAAAFVGQELRQPRLAANMRREVARFLRDGGRLVVEIAPGDDAWLSELQLLPPETVAARLNPHIGAQPRPPALAADLLAAIRSGDLTAEQRLAAARASLEGRGMPRDPERGLALLRPLAESTRTDTTSSAARALYVREGLERGLDPAEAYPIALGAAMAGEPLHSLLDQLERRLGADAVLAAQTRNFEDWPDRPEHGSWLERTVAAGDSYALLERAREFASGRGHPRSLANSLTLALLAEAAGEVGATGLVNELRGRADGDGYRDAVDAATRRATELWLGGMVGAVQERAAVDAPENVIRPRAPAVAPRVVQTRPITPPPSSDDEVVRAPDIRLAVPNATISPSPIASADATPQAAMLYGEGNAQRDASSHRGSVVWSVTRASPGNGNPAEPAPRAAVAFPDAGLEAVLTLRRNSDPALAASHLLEANFEPSPAFAGGNVDELAAIRVRAHAEDGGTALAIVPAKIAPGHFYVAFDNMPSARSRNLELMRTARWVDIAFTKARGERGLISIELGRPGTAAIAALPGTTVANR